jgi:hypothetical protein
MNTGSTFLSLNNFPVIAMQSTSPLSCSVPSPLSSSNASDDNASDALDRFHEAIRIGDLDECNRLHDEGGINVGFMNCDGHRPIRTAFFFSFFFLIFEMLR